MCCKSFHPKDCPNASDDVLDQYNATLRLDTLAYVYTKDYPVEIQCYLVNHIVDDKYINGVIEHFLMIYLYESEVILHKRNFKNIEFNVSNSPFLKAFRKIGGDTQGEVFLSSDVLDFVKNNAQLNLNQRNKDLLFRIESI